MTIRNAALVGALIFGATVAQAQEAAEPTSYSGVMALPVPVTAGDITDRPYCVVGPVKKEVRKATIFSKASSPEKVRREIWESARKKGADAVINFEAGNSRVTGISWGATPVKGTMVKFSTAGTPCPAVPAKS